MAKFMFFALWNKWEYDSNRYQQNLLKKYYFRGVDVENAIKLAAADDGFVTYDEIREHLRK